MIHVAGEIGFFGHGIDDVSGFGVHQVCVIEANGLGNAFHDRVKLGVRDIVSRAPGSGGELGFLAHGIWLRAM